MSQFEHKFEANENNFGHAYLGDPDNHVEEVDEAEFHKLSTPEKPQSPEVVLKAALEQALDQANGMQNRIVALPYGDSVDAYSVMRALLNTLNV